MMQETVILLLYLVVCAHSVLRFDLIDKNVSHTLDNLLLPSKYNKKIRPEIGGPATKVMVNMYIKSIGPVSESEGSYTMDLYFRQQWFDKRLSFTLPGLNELTMSWLFLEKIWKPDTYFMNGKASHLHRITSPNKFLRLRHDGFMTYSMRLTLTASCTMHLRKFPMDSQSCNLIIASYGYSKRDVLYEWSGSGMVVEHGVELAQYDLVNVSIENKKIVTRDSATSSVVSSAYIRVVQFMFKWSGIPFINRMNITGQNVENQ